MATPDAASNIDAHLIRVLAHMARRLLETAEPLAEQAGISGQVAAARPVSEPGVSRHRRTRRRRLLLGLPDGKRPDQTEECHA
jgi:hypothetical protein